MARDYGKIMNIHWTDKWGPKLRKLGSDAGLVAVYLKSGPASNWIGLYSLAVPLMAHHLGLTNEAATEALRRVCETGYCFWDEERELVFLPHMAGEEIAEKIEATDNRRKGIVKDVLSFRNSPFAKMFCAIYRVHFLLPKDLIDEINALHPALHPGSPLVSPLPSPFEAKGPSKPIHNNSIHNNSIHNSSEHFISGEEKKSPAPKKPDPEIPAGDDQPDASIHADARECSIAWRKTILGRKPDVLDPLGMCDDTFADMLMRGISKTAILGKIGIRKKRGRLLSPFCDELENDLGTTPQNLYARPMLDEQFQNAPEEEVQTDFDAGWLAFERDFKKYLRVKNVDFLDRVKAKFAKIHALPEEMLFALDCYLDDKRRDNRSKQWDGRFPTEAHRFLPGYIVENREEARRAKEREAFDARMAAQKQVGAAQASAQERPVEPHEQPALDPENAKIAAAISASIGSARFDLWFVGKTRFERSGGGLCVHAANLFLQDWLKKTFGADIEAATGMTVTFAVDQALLAGSRTAHAKAPREGAQEKAG